MDTQNVSCNKSKVTTFSTNRIYDHGSITVKEISNRRCHRRLTSCSLYHMARLSYYNTATVLLLFLRLFTPFAGVIGMSSLSTTSCGGGECARVARGDVAVLQRLDFVVWRESEGFLYLIRYVVNYAQVVFCTSGVYAAAVVNREMQHRRSKHQGAMEPMTNSSSHCLNVI
jgi:hypothetical protein